MSFRDNQHVFIPYPLRLSMSGLPNVVKAALVGGGLDVATSQQVPPLGRGGREGGRILNVTIRAKNTLKRFNFASGLGRVRHIAFLQQ